MITESQLHQLAELCRQASDIEIMPRFRLLEDTHIEQKLNHNDLVTIADQAAEKFIMERLHALYPDALLIGEESVYADTTALDQYQDAELSFVLDPIDGTWHYANGSVYFGVMLGVASYGKMIGGIIFEPVTGHYLWALEGKGAFDRINGTDHPLHVGRHASRKLYDTMGCYSFGVAKGDEREQALQVASKLGRLMDYRCAAAEYRLLVTGAISFVVFQNTLNLWDHGAGQLIAKEAGAATRMLNEEDYQPQVVGKLIVAESEARWQELATLFNSN